jgi:hypothetical protein
MSIAIIGTAAAAGLVVTGMAGAQTGTLDQSSPYTTGANSQSFNIDTSTLVWQQQVRAGLSGQLEGVRFTFLGVAGAQADVRIRLGPAWSSSAPSFSTRVVKAIDGFETVFVSMTSAGLHLSSGDVFVIETQGNGTGMNLIGSYIAPPGAPLYPEPLFLTQSSFADGGYRHGFQTFMLTGSTCYPNCDGSTTTPVLNVQDFTCFLQKFATGNLYANCDGSTTVPVLNVQDFTCFLQKFALGCQ